MKGKCGQDKTYYIEKDLLLERSFSLRQYYLSGKLPQTWTLSPRTASPSLGLLVPETRAELAKKMPKLKFIQIIIKKNLIVK